MIWLFTPLKSLFFSVILFIFIRLKVFRLSHLSSNHVQLWIQNIALVNLFALDINLNKYFKNQSSTAILSAGIPPSSTKWTETQKESVCIYGRNTMLLLTSNAFNFPSTWMFKAKRKRDANAFLYIYFFLQLFGLDINDYMLNMHTKQLFFHGKI